MRNVFLQLDGDCSRGDRTRTEGRGGGGGRGEEEEGDGGLPG